MVILHVAFDVLNVSSSEITQFTSCQDRAVSGSNHLSLCVQALFSGAKVHIVTLNPFSFELAADLVEQVAWFRIQNRNEISAIVGKTTDTACAHTPPRAWSGCPGCTSSSCSATSGAASPCTTCSTGRMTTTLLTCLLRCWGAVAM